jgi:hypothetical protein
MIKAKKFYFTGTGAIAASAPAAPGGSKLNAVLLHLSVGGAVGDLTVKLNSVKDAAYDTIFETQAMSGVTDYTFIPTNPVVLSEGDSIDVAYAANAGGTTYGLQIILLDE